MSWVMDHLGLIPKHNSIFSLTWYLYHEIKVSGLKPGVGYKN